MFLRLTASAALMAGLNFTPQLLAGEGQAQTPIVAQQLTDEVKNLRKEFFQDLHERQTEKVKKLEEGLDQVRDEYRQIETALDAQEREITEWLNDLQSSELSPQDRLQAQLARREASAEGAQKLLARRARAVSRETELVQHLSREKDRLRRLVDALDPKPR